MNQTWNSFLQTVFQFVKSLFVNVSKKMHRNAVVMTAGISVVTVMTFTAGDFQGGGKNALVAFAETSEQTNGAETELEEADPEGLAAADESEEQQETASETEDTDTLTDPEENAEAEEGSETGEESLREDDADAGDVMTDERPEDVAEYRALKAAEEESQEAESVPEKEDEQEEANAAALSDKDYNVLLRIVQAESGGCDVKGRILVANVILNRVESNEFPDSVSGVVYEKYQFSPVMDGSINSCKVSQQTIDAVERALAGEDYSEGALYFMNRRRSSAKNVNWFDSHLSYLFQYGDHEFFK